MQKTSLKDRLKSRNDYGVFAIEKPAFRKYPLREFTEASFRSDYHKAKIGQAIRTFQTLNGLTVSEYFKYLPLCMERLRHSPFIDPDLEDSVSDMTMGQVLFFFGSQIKDFEHDYATDLVSILTEPVRDSRYTHPLFKTLFIHSREMAKKLSDGNSGSYEPDAEKRLYISLNDLLRICNDAERTFAPFFNNVVIPSMVVRKYL